MKRGNDEQQGQARDARGEAPARTAARSADSRAGTSEKPDQLAEKEAEAEDRQEALLDEGLEETFPGSDPVSVKRIT